MKRHGGRISDGRAVLSGFALEAQRYPDVPNQPDCLATNLRSARHTARAPC